MQVRDNVRERRRNRILQLTGSQSESRPPARMASDAIGYSEEELSMVPNEPIVTTPGLVSPREARAGSTPSSNSYSGSSLSQSSNPSPAEDSLSALDRWLETSKPRQDNSRTVAVRKRNEVDIEPDPEKWWKERQRLQFANLKSEEEGSLPPSVMGSIKRLSDFPNLARGGGGWQEGPPLNPSGGAMGRFLRGFMIRLALALLLLGGAWAWFRYELPGSEAAHGWTVQALTRDMDYVAVQEWYERTFGSTPAFLELLNRPDNSEAVAASWSREDIVLPMEGAIVRTFAQDGKGIRMSAAAGSLVKAVHTGRVTKVTRDEQGIATIQIQHPNSVISVYGNVDNALVKANDWVETGAPLGELAEPSQAAGATDAGGFYFALEQNGRSLDPAEVIPFD